MVDRVSIVLRARYFGLCLTTVGLRLVRSRWGSVQYVGDFSNIFISRPQDIAESIYTPPTPLDPLWTA